MAAERLRAAGVTGRSVADWFVPRPGGAPAQPAAEPATLPGKGLAQHPFLYCGEVNKAGDIVWEINKNDLPGIPLYTAQEVTRLANGNTLINPVLESSARHFAVQLPAPAVFAQLPLPPFVVQFASALLPASSEQVAVLLFRVFGSATT